MKNDDSKGLKPIAIQERCAIELGLLERFDAFARENGLTYWLFWGLYSARCVIRV